MKTPSLLTPLLALSLTVVVIGCLTKGVNGTPFKTSSVVNATVSLSSKGVWTVSSGIDKSGVAWASYVVGMNTTGWDTLQMEANSAYPSAVQGYAMGYLEAYLTHHGMWLIWINTVDALYGQMSLPANVDAFLDANMNWTKSQVALNEGDEFWTAVNFSVNQIQGLSDGYAAFFDSSDGEQPLTYTQVVSLTANGDVGTIVAVQEGYDHVRAGYGQHCSGFVKVTDDLSELFIGHTTWYMFQTMLRIYKSYTYTLDGASGAVTITFSSYPGYLTSTDDFYQTSNNLAVTETSNGLFNQSLLNLVTYDRGLTSWIRVICANSLATTAPEWVQYFNTSNGGTYNNQWMVVDYNLFTPGEDLPPNLFWIYEQTPTVCPGADMTAVLERGYWPSYNVPYFKSVYDVSGFPAQLEKFGSIYDYDLSPRANIFRRNQTDAVDINSFAAVLRYNNWEYDPLSLGYAGNAISSRFDLDPPPPSSATSSFPFMQQPFGGIDTKATSNTMMPTLSNIAEDGPTHDQQPVFAWKDWESYAHEGLPEKYDFGFVTIEWGNV